jgi:hypothetical protein
MGRKEFGGRAAFHVKRRSALPRRATKGRAEVSATEWFLLIVVVILIPLAIAVAVTLWSLEQARQRNKKNRPNANVRRIAVPQPPAPSEHREAGQVAAADGDGVTNSPAHREDGAGTAGRSVPS